MNEMIRLGYWLSSEEHGPNELVRNAARAEEAGFTVAGISDHFHPWVPEQGESPFVWTVLGGIARDTERLQLVTGVTAPIIRIHPVIVAQAAATAAVMLEGRFALGAGTGERLNEHVTGALWPTPDVRRDMLEEAIGVMRRLWSGENVDHHGRHYVVEQAQLFTRPETPPAVIVAGSSGKSARLAGRVGDGFFGVIPSSRHVEAFEGAGGQGKRRIAQLHVCWAATEAEALDVAYRWWRVGALRGAVMTELAHPKHFEQVLELARPDDVAGAIALGPDPATHLDAINRFAEAGFDEVHVHQIGPDQDGFFRFYQREILPQFNLAANSNTERPMHAGAQADLRRREPREVIEDHLRLSQEGGLDDDLERNYDPEVVILYEGQAYRGFDGARELARLLERQAPGARFNYERFVVDGAVGLLEWSGEGHGVDLRDGADSYVVQNGRIVTQTIHYRVADHGTAGDE